LELINANEDRELRKHVTADVFDDVAPSGEAGFKINFLSAKINGPLLIQVRTFYTVFQNRLA